MPDNTICPLCGSDNIVQSETFETICDPFGGCKEVVLAYDRCNQCDIDGDFAKKNDTLIREAIEELRLDAVKNILNDFAEHKFNFAGLERSLELPQRTLTKWKNGTTSPSAAGVTLLKFLRLFPWLVDVADHKFDYDEAQRIYIEQGVKSLLSEVNFNQSLGNDENNRLEIAFHISLPAPLTATAPEYRQFQLA